MRLRSNRVFLRAPERDDFVSLKELYRRSRTHFAGLASSHYTQVRFDAMLRDAASDAYEHFLICLLDDGSIVGTISFSQIFRKSFQNAYLGYQLFAGCTGCGYMTEAVALSLRFAFDDLSLHRIEANVQPTNKPSIAVLKRNGFAKEGFSRRYLKIGGRWRDHERWAILKEDWKRQRANARNGREN